MKLLHLTTLLALCFAAISLAQDNPYYVTSPMPGTVFQVGDTINIAWLNGLKSSVTVNVLTGKNVAALTRTGVSFTLKDGSVGSYSWKVPSTLNGSDPFAFQFEYTSASGSTEYNYSGQFYIGSAVTTTFPAATTTTTVPVATSTTVVPKTTTTTTRPSETNSSASKQATAAPNQDDGSDAPMLKAAGALMAVPALMVAVLAF